MAQSPIKSKEQDIKNSSGGEGWKQREKGLGRNFKKVGQAIQGSLHNIRGVRNPLQTMTHKELFWKKDVLIFQEKSFKRLVKEFIFSKAAGQKPSTLQNLNLITVIIEEFCLIFPEQVFHRIHLSGCFLKLYSQHCLTEVL